MGNIFINGRPVCDDYADNNVATVVCRYNVSKSSKRIKQKLFYIDPILKILFLECLGLLLEL